MVITIIILLILAGISILAITSDNGLFTRAKEAREKTNEAEAKEKVELLLAEYQAEKVDNEALTLSEFLETKNEKLESTEDNGNGEVEIIVNGYLITVN